MPPTGRGGSKLPPPHLVTAAHPSHSCCGCPHPRASAQTHLEPGARLGHGSGLVSATPAPWGPVPEPGAGVRQGALTQPLPAQNHPSRLPESSGTQAAAVANPKSPDERARQSPEGPAPSLPAGGWGLPSRQSRSQHVHHFSRPCESGPMRGARGAVLAAPCRSGRARRWRRGQRGPASCLPCPSELTALPRARCWLTVSRQLFLYLKPSTSLPGPLIGFPISSTARADF